MTVLNVSASEPCFRYEILKECEALVIFVVHHGDILKEQDQKYSFRKLSSVVSKCRDGTPTTEEWQKLVEAYAGDFFSPRCSQIKTECVGRELRSCEIRSKCRF